MSDKLDPNFFINQLLTNCPPTILDVLANADDGIFHCFRCKECVLSGSVIEQRKRSPVETIILSQEMKNRTNDIIEENEKIKEKVNALSAEIDEVDVALKEKKKAIHELEMKKAEKVNELWNLHAQLKTHDEELDEIVLQFASLLMDNNLPELNVGDSPSQDTNQLDKNVGTSSENSEQEAPAMIDITPSEKIDSKGTNG